MAENNNSNIKYRIIRNTFINSFATIMVIAIGFLLLPYMIAKLGVVEYGLIGIVNIFSVAGYIGLLDLGLQVSIVKYIAEYNKRDEKVKINSLVSTSFLIFSVISIVAFFLGFLMSNILVTRVLQVPEQYIHSFRTALMLIFFTYFFEFPNLLFSGILEGLQRYDIVKSLYTGSYAVYAVLVFGFLYSGYGYISIILIMLAISLMKLLLNIYFSYKQLPYLKIRFRYISKDIMKEISRMTRLIFYSRIASIINLKSDQLFIGIFLGPVFMTSYQVIVKLPQVIKTVVGFGNSAIFPVASELQAVDDKVLLKKLFLRGWRFNLFVFLPIITGAIYFSAMFIANWVGPEFIKLAGMQRLYLTQYLFFLLVAFGSTMLVGMNKDLGKMTVINITGTVLKIVLLLVLIKKLQLLGIIAATVCSMILPMPFLIRLILKAFDIRKLTYLKEYFKVSIVLIIPYILFYFIREYLVYDSIVMVLIYGMIWCLISWFGIYFLTMDVESRAVVKDVMNGLLARLNFKKYSAV